MINVSKFCHCKISIYIFICTVLDHELKVVLMSKNVDVSCNRSFYFLSVLDSMAQIIFPSFFTPRLTNYNLRGRGSNVVQPPHNSLVMHSSFLYIIAHQLPAYAKSSTTLAEFRARLTGMKFAGCQCVNYI